MIRRSTVLGSESGSSTLVKKPFFQEIPARAKESLESIRLIIQRIARTFGNENKSMSKRVFIGFQEKRKKEKQIIKSVYLMRNLIFVLNQKYLGLSYMK